MINSPERFRKQLEQASRGLEEEQRDIRQLEKRVKELQLWLESIDVAEAEVRLASEDLGETVNEFQRLKDAETAAREAEQALGAKREEARQLDQALQQLSRKAVRCEERLHGLRGQSDVRATESMKALEALQDDIREASVVKKNMIARADQLEEKVITLRRTVDGERMAQEQVRAPS